MLADPSRLDIQNDDLRGQKAGAFVLEKRLGKGGFGVVYLGRHEEKGFPAAVKILNRPLIDIREIMLRFQREANFASRLRHPHIAGLYEHGAWAGTLYFVMEYVDGPSLWDYQREQPEKQLPLDWTLRMMKECASALKCAHEAGLVHRDIKPGNIMIASSGKLYLVDFGLAKDLMATTITKSRVVMGTLEYMAPEQLKGLKADIRSDLYSLGLVWWQCLTGKLPFNSHDQSVLAKTREVDMADAAAKLRPDLPKGYQTVLGNLLAYHTLYRYPDPSSLLADLERIERGDAPEFTPELSQTSEVSLSEEDRAQIVSGQILKGSPGR